MQYFTIILIVVSFFSCNTVEREVVISQFNETFIDTIRPIGEKGYSTMKLQINGEVNDSVVIFFQGTPKYYIGSFSDERLGDFYGGNESYLEIKVEPYKATKGSLELKYGIY